MFCLGSLKELFPLEMFCLDSLKELFPLEMFCLDSLKELFPLEMFCLVSLKELFPLEMFSLGSLKELFALGDVLFGLSEGDLPGVGTELQGAHCLQVVEYVRTAVHKQARLKHRHYKYTNYHW